MNPFEAVIYSFLLGLLHGILPDEHTWPITLSYAIGSANGRRGMRAGLLFSAAFTVQRAILAEVAYLALAPFLLRPTVNGIVYIVVGATMSIAGGIVLRRGRYVHLHVIGHHHDEGRETASPLDTVAHPHHKRATSLEAPPVHWTLVHGFIAGFGFGGFSAFVNTVAAPAMRSPWLGFIPGLVFGLGTMAVLVAIGGLFGASLRWTKLLLEDELRQLGALVGGRALFFGGFLFAVAGAATLAGLARYSPIDPSYLLIGLFLVGVVVPAFILSLRDIRRLRRPRCAGGAREPWRPPRGAEEDPVERAV